VKAVPLEFGGRSEKEEWLRNQEAIEAKQESSKKIQESKSEGKPLNPPKKEYVPPYLLWTVAKAEVPLEPAKRGEESIQAVSAARVPKSQTSSNPTTHTDIKHLFNYKYFRHNDPPKLPRPMPPPDYTAPTPFAAPTPSEAG